VSVFELDDVSWHSRARCTQKTDEARSMKPLFFSPELLEQRRACNFCFGCEVRNECLKWALDTKQLWGVWGGRTEDDIRRALSVSHTGEEIRRRRSPQCPYCSARPVCLSVSEQELAGGGRWSTAKIVTCGECGFHWRSRTSANAVNAYHAAREAKERKKLKKALREKKAT
jgi:WhiB family redox-sensing transcriptional regulator